MWVCILIKAHKVNRVFRWKQKSYDIFFSLLGLWKYFLKSVYKKSKRNKVYFSLLLLSWLLLFWLVDRNDKHWSSYFKQMDFLSVTVQYNCASATDLEEQLQNLQVNTKLVFFISLIQYFLLQSNCNCMIFFLVVSVVQPWLVHPTL